MSTGFADDVRRGLSAECKFLQPKYFYDALGSALFDAICHLPEYYVTRTETEILTTNGAEIADAFAPPVRLVELGAGSGRKTRLLIEALLVKQESLEYAPLDIDPHVLESAAHELRVQYPSLRVTPLVGDFMDPRAALERAPQSTSGSAVTPTATLRTVVLFLGSTIGNLDADEAVRMLTNVRAALSPGDALFLGADLRKPREVLEPAYDDPLGVTAAFNKNILGRINRELGGHFDLAAFDHRAHYDERRGRIEMHLVSNRAQRVRIDALDAEIAFAAGESIHTENSHKYDEAALRELTSRAGFEMRQLWCDERRWFADVLLTIR